MLKLETNQEAIYSQAVEMVRALVEKRRFKTFKVETKRADKKYPMNSLEVSKDLGGVILNQVPGLKVDVNNPEFIFYVEIREYTYLYSEIIPCAKGLPVGSNGKATLLISGGIDSPVAGWMVAKRGVRIEAVHFYSYPYPANARKTR